MNLQKKYSVGIYCRLSQDDGNQNSLGEAMDSSSIQTQKMMLEKYCKDNHYQIYDYYIDDGFSGTNFNRPSFQRLLKDINSGVINMVITKDLSRLGRDYIQCGYYTEIYFPDRNVRYVAINDNIDTLKNDNDIAPFKNILNDIYIRDLSRKIKMAMKQRAMQGMFVGSAAPYGYIKDPNNKNKLLINPETSKIVRHIFNLMLSGYGAVYIAKRLAKEKVFIPAVVKLKAGDTRFQRNLEYGSECRWHGGLVRRILNNPVYTGDIVYYKTQIINYKTKKSVSNPKDKWIVVPNMHEAIVTHEEFERAQQLMRERHIPRIKYDIENLFKGLVKCSICGKPMTLITQKRRGKLVSYYRCNTFMSLRVEQKHWTTIKYNELKEIVVSRLKQFFNKFKDDIKLMDFVRSKIKDNNITIDYHKELLKIESRLNTLSRITKKVYDDYFEGVIDEETYQDLIRKYQDEEKELKDKHLVLSKETSNTGNYQENMINSFLELNVLTKEMVYNLIDEIVIDNVGEYKQHKQRTIKIIYRFKEET